MRVELPTPHVVTWFRQKPVQGAPLPVPQTFGVLAPQIAPPVHVPHWTRPPQPSAIQPHPFAGQFATVFGVHWFAPPHMLGAPPPPQISGDVHAGQLATPPQPSATGPHWRPVCAHVFGVHPAPPSPVTLPPPHTLG
jgi:hypothetical protein